MVLSNSSPLFVLPRDYLNESDTDAFMLRRTPEHVLSISPSSMIAPSAERTTVAGFLIKCKLFFLYFLKVSG